MLDWFSHLLLAHWSSEYHQSGQQIEDSQANMKFCWHPKRKKKPLEGVKVSEDERLNKERPG